MICPNPLNPKRYVVLNSGFTFREFDYLNNRANFLPQLCIVVSHACLWRRLILEVLQLGAQLTIDRSEGTSVALSIPCRGTSSGP